MIATRPPDPAQPEPPFLGLAPFLRMSIAGTDFLPVAREMLARAEHDAGNANLWMNLSIAMLCLGQRDSGLAIQARALEMQRVYHLAATRQPAKLRLLMLVVPGDLAANMPLDCLLENSDIDLDYYYVSSDDPLALPLPEHDALVVAMSESDANRGLLARLELELVDWPKPVINSARNIPNTDRNAASVLLQDIPGLLIPPTLRASRSALQDIATGKARLPALFDSCDFPIILRPVGSHAGRDLDKIGRAEEISAYLSGVDETEFFLSRFIDYSGQDGLFRKIRVALIDGAAYVCHMAVSSDWMVHYVNADMYGDAQKRAEEVTFMAHFDDFARRHRSALEAIYRRTGLDYVCIDCAQTREGQLLVFEIDHAMVVHAMDPDDLFPYKRKHMQKVQDAFRDLVLRQASGRAPGVPA
jgi:glutathione synthase/RimK-type ligase-like ATP-grasp enzyme